MNSGIYRWLFRNFPQNFILRKPLTGTVILIIFVFLFLVLYKPLHVHAARSLSIEATMAAYSIILSIPVFITLILLKRVPYFSDSGEWTLLKEILAILIVLTVYGISIYFEGFIMERPVGNRWNFATFFNSVGNSYLIGIIPFGFFFLMNFRFLFYPETIQYYNKVPNRIKPDNKGELIHISSQLKKESLDFYPDHFLYAEADANYVIFHFVQDGKQIKRTIRNSINNIEKQLSQFHSIMRVHRAFIVNMKKINSTKGNTLGYRLRISGTDIEIPVARNYTKDFSQSIKRFS
jgi:hypothetical protein